MTARIREIAFDTETTGLNPADGDRVIEIDGKPMTLSNPASGKEAQCYELTMRGVQMVLDPKSRRIA